MPEIKFPENFIAPYDLSSDAEMNSYVITVGYKSYQLSKKYNDILYQSKQSLNHLEVKEEYDKSINEIVSRYEQDIKKLIDENKNLKLSQISYRDQEIEEIKNAYENKLKKYKDQLTNIESVNEKQIADLNKKLNEQENDIKKYYEEKIKELETESKEIKKHVNDQYQTEKNQLLNDIISLRQTIDTLTTSRIEQQEELRKSLETKYREEINYERNRTAQLQTTITALSSTIQKPSSTVEIGQIGEEMIERWTKELFCSADVTVTTKESHAADLHVKLHNRMLLLEIKNMGTIYKRDIDKFIRDVENNSSIINGALFISLNTPAIPNKGDFTLEYVGEIPVIYCHVPDKQTLRVAIKTLLHLNSKEDNGALTMLINNLYTSIKSCQSTSISLSKNIDDSRSNLDSLRRDIKSMIDSLDDLFSESPDLKIEKSVQALDYKSEEIKIIIDTYSANPKAKVTDYMNALHVTQKYLLDRGGMNKIKTIIKTSHVQPPKIIFQNIPIMKLL